MKLIAKERPERVRDNASGSSVERAGRAVALLGLAPLTGGMLFFGTIMAPLVFAILPEPVAGTFIRAAFPLFYGYVVICATLAACGYLILGRKAAAGALFAIVAATYWSWFWQLPHLDALRRAGNMAAFTSGHEFSVWVYGAEMVSAFLLLLRFGWTIP
jgi:hypothetical protein